MRPTVLGAVVVVLLQSLILYFAWVGYIGSDDWVYISNARDRIHSPLMIGSNHWEVRLPHVWPLSLSFAALGESESTAALPTLLAAVLTALILYLFLAKRLPPPAPILVAAVVATSPLLAINATSLRVDTTEVLLVTTALLCLFAAMESSRARNALLLAGLFGGLAFITRPTTVGFLVFVACLWIVAYGIPRRSYLWVALGFLIVWGAETLYYWYGTGDAFYRFHVDFRHDQVDRGGSIVEQALLSPLKMLLFSHSLGITYWLFPFAAFAFWTHRSVGASAQRLMRFLSAFTVVWLAVFGVFATKLVLDPRYTAPATVAALVVTASWLIGLWYAGKRVLAAALLCALVGINVLAIAVENKDMMYAERWLANLAASAGEPIYTDPQTAERAAFLLELKGIRLRVRPHPPPDGSLFLAVPRNAARGLYNAYRWSPDDFAPGAWQVVATLDPGRTAIGVLLEGIGVNKFVPEGVWAKLDHPNPPITLFRRSTP